MGLSPAARFALVEISEGDGVPWELAWMKVETHAEREAYVYGPGALAATEAERLQMARSAVQELLDRDLLEVRRGKDWVNEEGVEVTDDEVDAVLADPLTWRWPMKPERSDYVWFVATLEGARLAELVSLSDVPRVPLPSAGLRARASNRAGRLYFRILLRAADTVGRIERTTRTWNR